MFLVDNRDALLICIPVAGESQESSGSTEAGQGHEGEAGRAEGEGEKGEGGERVRLSSHDRQSYPRGANSNGSRPLDSSAQVINASTLRHCIASQNSFTGFRR